MEHTFKPGDKVICVKTHSKGMVKKDQIYTIINVSLPTCDCHSQLIDVGLIHDCKYSKCSKCGTRRSSTLYWLSNKLFAPYNPPRERIVYVAETLRETVQQLELSN